MTEIQSALIELNDANRALAAAKERLWAALIVGQPQLLELVIASGLNQDQAKRWLIDATLADGQSALELIAAGRTDQVRSAVMRTLHGVYG